MMANLFRTGCVSAILLASFDLPLSALQVHDYEKARHLRFDEGSFPDNPVPNPTLWANDHVFSGVGWSEDDPRKGFALISPRHFVGANHFRPSLGSRIAFQSTDGQIRSYTYKRFYNIKNSENENTDIFIGELSANIPASHKIPLYPILDQPESDLVNREIVVYGRGESGPRVGRGTIGGFRDSFGTNPIGSGPLNDTRNYSFEYFETTATQDDAYGETGDSGSPSFISEDGMLTVSGIHSAVQSLAVITTYDSFLLHYKDQINDHLAETGHQVTLAPVQEGTLNITNIERDGSTIVISVENPSGLPYDVHRTDDLASGDWAVVATSQSENTWTGEVPPDANHLFWKLIPYPLPQP